MSVYTFGSSLTSFFFWNLTVLVRAVVHVYQKNKPRGNKVIK